VFFNMPKNPFFGLMGGTAGKVIYTFFNNKWHVDYVLNHYLAKPALRFGHDVTYY
jgi:hypothetical protein